MHDQHEETAAALEEWSETDRRFHAMMHDEIRWALREGRSRQSILKQYRRSPEQLTGPGWHEREEREVAEDYARRRNAFVQYALDTPLAGEN